MKKNNKKAESLVGIVIGIFILSFVLLGIGSLISNSKKIITEFNEKMDIDILSKNTAVIINQLDLSVVYEGDIFYIYKDNENKNYKIFIGEHNREYKYIDKYGNKIDNPMEYKGIVYTRILQTKKIKVNGEDKTAIKTLIKKLNR